MGNLAQRLQSTFDWSGINNDMSRVEMNAFIFAAAFVMIGCMLGVVAMSLAMMAKDVGEQEAETARQRQMRAPR